ncbi:MAG: MoxR family ATPase [Magnetococcus sp. DMHC-6]
MTSRHLLQQIANKVGEVILGKKHAIHLAIVCLLARGHLLIEDDPGVGKTTLAHALALVLGVQFQRIQFTSDLLPADILGVSVFDRQEGLFRFHPGPIFSQLVLADEINRATPKAQSALLEAMAEGQVTVDGQTRALPRPFFVIATQNAGHQVGTFPLPQSQLDRFLMRLHLGYPDFQAERELLLGEDRRLLLEHLQPCLQQGELEMLQHEAAKVYASPALLDYLQALLAFSRQPDRFQSGLSPRSGLALLHCAKAHAFLEDRRSVLPEDLQRVLPAVTAHRLGCAMGSSMDASTLLLHSVPIP